MPTTELTRNLTLKIKRYNPELDVKPHWEKLVLRSWRPMGPKRAMAGRVIAGTVGLVALQERVDGEDQRAAR